VDRADIFHRFDEPALGECIGLIAEACAPGVIPHIENEDNRGLPLHGLVPEPMIDALVMGKPVGGPVAEMFQELPEVRDDLLEQPLLSTQWFPIFIEGQWWGFVGFDDNYNEREWKEEEIVLLQMVADVFGSTLQRWEAERALQEERDTLERRVQERTALLEKRLRMERILATTAERLMTREDFRKAVKQSLQEIGSALGATEVLLVQVNVESRQILNRYIWHPPEVEDWQPPSEEATNWFRRQMLRRSPLYIPDVAGDFEEGDAVREYLLSLPVKALMTYPLLVEEELAGIFSVSFDRPLPEDEVGEIIEMLDILANLLNGLLQRQLLTERRDRQLLEQTRAISAMLDAAMLDASASDLSVVVKPILNLIADLSHAQTLAVYGLQEDGSYGKIAEQGAVDTDTGWCDVFQPSPKLSEWLQGHAEPLLLNPDQLAETVPFRENGTGPGVTMIVDIRAWRHFDGLLFCYRPGEEQYSPTQVAMATALADYMSTIIENYLLREIAESTAIIEERQRLARDLHDSVSQSLYGVMLFARAARDALEAGEQEALAIDLTQVEENALRAMKEMRLLLFQLQPVQLEQGGLASALQTRFEQVEGRLGIDTSLEIDPALELPPQISETLYRLASEALNNALKHANATKVGVRLIRQDSAIVLTVFDNGRGFDPEEAADARGMGLANMRFRSEKVGGILTIASVPGQGTTIQCRIPRETVSG
jgi:signal transduction histidine kinase